MTAYGGPLAYPGTVSTTEADWQAPSAGNTSFGGFDWNQGLNSVLGFYAGYNNRGASPASNNNPTESGRQAIPRAAPESGGSNKTLMIGAGLIAAYFFFGSGKGAS